MLVNNAAILLLAYRFFLISFLLWPRSQLQLRTRPALFHLPDPTGLRLAWEPKVLVPPCCLSEQHFTDWSRGPGQSGRGQGWLECEKEEDCFPPVPLFLSILSSPLEAVLAHFLLLCQNMGGFLPYKNESLLFIKVEKLKLRDWVVSTLDILNVYHNLAEKFTGIRHHAKGALNTWYGPVYNSSLSRKLGINSCKLGINPFWN